MNYESTNIFSPFTIKNLTLRNRICSTGHFAEWMSDDGLPNDAFVAYMEERARGGIALVTIGATVVTRDGGPIYLQNLDDRFTGRYQAVADAVHKHGAKVIAQLIHVGDQAPVVPGRPAARLQIGERMAQLPGDKQPLKDIDPPKRQQRSAHELREIIKAFGRGAFRAKIGGMDGVELHAHERYLHAQFLSPVHNQRKDAYGGSLDNRSRLVTETLTAMREETGDDFVVGIRLKARDFHPDGMVEEDYIQLIQSLTETRLIDYVSLTAGTDHVHHGPMYLPDGELLPIVGRIRREIDVPVIHAGRITNARLAEQALAMGQVDIVGMTKTHIADPHFVRKLSEGRTDDIRHCIRCLDCLELEPVTCIYNPTTSREHEWKHLEQAPNPKRIVIVGAGPAGMEAALTSAQRGHDVVVFEKTRQVGGQVRLAGAGPLRSKFMEIAEFYERQATKGLFDLRTGVDTTRKLVRNEHPDVVLVATGSHPIKPSVPGLSSDQLLSVTDVLAGHTNTLERVLIVDRDGSAPAFVAADYLSSRNVTVEFVAAMDKVASNLGDRDGALLYQKLSDRGVLFYAGLDILHGHGRQLLLQDISAGSQQLLGPFDAVVIAAGDEPNSELMDELSPEFDPIYAIGSASRALSIREATVDGATTGRMI